MTYSLSMVPTESELKSYQIIAKVAATNPFWKKVGGGGSEDSIIATILSVMLLARELGISPMQAVSGGINNIKGKFEISARLMNQLIRKHGHTLHVKTLTNEICVIVGKRKDTGEEMSVSYHIEEAARSGLINEGGAWRKVPQDMLFARAISRIARRLYPDCIGGCYIEGELQEMISKKPVTIEEIGEVSALKNEMCEIEEDIKLDLPSNIDGEEVEAFISQTAEVTKVEPLIVKKRASSNLDGFLKAFHSWKLANISQGVVELNSPMTV